MKLDLDLEASVELSILNALEALTDQFRSPEDVDLQLATHYLRQFRDASQPWQSQLASTPSMTLNQSDFTLRNRS